MTKFKFANVLLENNPRAIEYPGLYCRATRPIVYEDAKNEWWLSAAGVYDFTTYFNSLSINKLRRYTNARAFYLHLELKGAPCSVVQTVANALSSQPEKLEETRFEVSESPDFVAFDVELKVFDNTVLAGFEIETCGAVCISNSYYSLALDSNPRDIELALATTTFKKEDYIKSNIALVKKEILDSADDIANHFTMHVVDNGSTLKPEDLEEDRVRIYPNENVGGAGGFAYGMIMALRQNPKASHVLLMDDDVAVSPESIKRTFNLLRIANSEYSDAFVSGAMLNYSAGDQQWEDMGFMSEDGGCRAIKVPLRLTNFDEVVLNESYWVPKEMRNPDHRYAAWWYCCMPTTAIEKHGLPLPYFVRYDDAEFGARCKPHFMTMNGLCIWHEAFNIRYNAAVERYQTTRNAFIAQATTGFAPNTDFEKQLCRNVHLELKKFGYDNAELCLDAFEDFLKGPDFYSKRGVAEETFMAANRNKERLISLDDLQRQVQELGFGDFAFEEIDRQLIDSDKPRSIKERIADYLTDNFQRVITHAGDGYVVIPEAGWAYPAGVIRDKRYIIVVDWYNKRGAIRSRDVKRYKAILRRLKADLKMYKRMKSDLLNQYAASRSVVTSMSFWDEYLGIGCK